MGVALATGLACVIFMLPVALVRCRAIERCPRLNAGPFASAAACSYTYVPSSMSRADLDLVRSRFLARRAACACALLRRAAADARRPERRERVEGRAVWHRHGA